MFHHCRLCGECKGLVQKIWRYDQVDKVVHWKLCQNYYLHCNDTWYDQVKLLWDFRIQTDHHLDHNRPDIVVLEKENRACRIIDVAIPFDTRIAEKEREKIDHYQDLKVEIQEMWNCKSVCRSNCNWGNWSSDKKPNAKYLGLTIHCPLSWHDHIVYTCSKISKKPQCYDESKAVSRQRNAYQYVHLSLYVVG